MVDQGGKIGKKAKAKAEAKDLDLIENHNNLAGMRLYLAKA
jgi:hypothetical protein